MSTPLQQIQAALATLGYPTAGTTNVPSIDWGTTGISVPTEAEILGGVLLDYNAATGGNINPAYNTPQGQLMSSQAAAIANCYAQVAAIVNGMDPVQNSGFMQDSIGRLFFLNRVAGFPTLVSCLCGGVAGTVIPIGALAIDPSQNIYSCVSGGTIPSSGQITLTFQNIVNGPIACAANSLSIYQAVSGWESISNPAAGELGALAQSSESYEYEREQAISSNGSGFAASVRGAILQLSGVADCFVYDNNTSSAITYGSTLYSIPAYAMFVGVTGGVAADIAQTLFEQKGPGSPLVGNTTETVTDPQYATYAQAPTYSITFNNNSNNPVTVNFNVALKNSTVYPSTIVSDVQAAITSQFTQGSAAAPPARSGDLLLASQFVYPVQTCEGVQIPVNVLSLYFGTAFVGTGTVASGSNVLTVSTVTSGTVSAGSPVTDASDYIPSGTIIVQQLSGTTGGVGTYQLSATATGTASSAEAVTCTANGQQMTIGIDQAPVIGAITVTLT